MGKFFSYDGGLMRTLNKIVDCFFLSVLWLLFSIPLVTIGASTTALYYTANKVIRHDRSHVWREFWAAFKENFKQSTIVWLIVAVMDWLLIANCILMYQMGQKAFMIFYIVLVAILTMWSIHLFPHIARFKNKLTTIMKNCALLAIRHFLKTIGLFLLFAVVVFVLSLWPILIVILPTGYMVVASYVLEPMFKMYMSEEDLEAEEERNMVYYN